MHWKGRNSMSSEFQGPDENVVIISIFGQSSSENNGFKSLPIENLIGSNLFNRNLFESLALDESALANIEGFYDSESKTIFLHLNGGYDTSTLVSCIKSFDENVKKKGFLAMWSEMRLEYVRLLLLMFCVSHVLILQQPSHVFNITYIHLFRTVDNIRLKLKDWCCKALNNIPNLSKEWKSQGRLCSPRVLFVFSSRLIPKDMLIEENTAVSHDITSSPIRKLELELENQIYRLFRKSRVITNISANSLFALPNNQPFVYVTESAQENIAASTLIKDALHDLCTSSKSSKPLVTNSTKTSQETGGKAKASSDVSSESANKYQTHFDMELKFANCLSETNTSDDLSNSLLSGISSNKRQNPEHSFSNFINLHLEEALTRGFNDNVGRHAPITPFFEIPKAGVWFEGFNALFDLLGTEKKTKDGTENKIVETIRPDIETEIRFSDARCAKVYPIALSAYNDDLPPHYTKTLHQSKLVIALNILASQASGPMCDKYMKKLKDTCLKIWLDGRIGCEKLSFTGKTCTQPKHVEKNEETVEDIAAETLEDKETNLPVLHHDSGISYVNYCNCGRHQTTMEDPFTIKSANFDMYQNLMDKSCTVIDIFTFPSFQSSVDNAKAAVVSSARGVSSGGFRGSKFSQSESYKGWTGDQGPITTQSQLEISVCESELSQDRAEIPKALNLSENFPKLPSDANTPKESREVELSPEISRPSELSGYLEDLGESGTPRAQDSGSGEIPNEDEIILSVTDEVEEYRDDLSETNMARQISTTEYLPGMLTTTSPSGLLPTFSSWSLVCLGPSSLYSHNAGICEQPGFISGTNFLLPWDVTVKIRDREKWPAIAECLGKKGLILRNRKRMSEFRVKIFLGAEYQCTRGHRFTMSAPDQHLKATTLGHVKDTASKISNSDMPLYFLCPCSRQNSFIIGQLMRIHIVTPKAPVHVTLNPQVEAAPGSPKFIPQPANSAPIRLSASAYWVLRLPFSYVGERDPFYPPSPYEVNVASYGRLIKGCYGISEINLDR